jgi:hypothetical protein
LGIEVQLDGMDKDFGNQGRAVIFDAKNMPILE